MLENLQSYFLGIKDYPSSHIHTHGLKQGKLFDAVCMFLKYDDA